MIYMALLLCYKQILHYRFFLVLFFFSAFATYFFLRSTNFNQYLLRNVAENNQSFFEKKHPRIKETNETVKKAWSEPVLGCKDERKTPRRKVAVFSASTPDFQNLYDITGQWQNSYAFYLPVTMFAWKRIGFESCIFITGKKAPWFDRDSPLNLVRSIIQAHRGTLIFLESEEELKSGIAQVARLFAANIAPFKDEPDTFILTSDTDILPIRNIYSIDPTTDIHITDAWCCYVVAHRSRAYRMFPMATIGMRVSTWQTVMAYEEYSNKPELLHRIKDTLLEEFGSLPYNMSRGVNGKWFFDQRLVSYRIGEWRRTDVQHKTCRLSLRKATESSNEFRWIRANWYPPDASLNDILKANDAHGPPDAPITKKGYKQLCLLANALTNDYDFNFTDYWETYTKMMTKVKKPR